MPDFDKNGNVLGDASGGGLSSLSGISQGITSLTDIVGGLGMGQFDYSQDGYTVEDAVKAAKAKSAKIGGGVGSGIGMAVGSIIPGLGTALGGALGGVLGKAFGGLAGGGKARETANRVLDNREAKMNSILEQKRNAFKENEMLNGSSILQTF